MSEKKSVTKTAATRKAPAAKKKAAATKVVATKKKIAAKKKAVPTKVAATKKPAAKKKAVSTEVAATKKKTAAKKKAVLTEVPAKKKPATTRAPAKKKPATNVATSSSSSPPSPPSPSSPSSPPRPSERAMAIAAQLPKERPLTDEERDAMTKVAQTALAALETDGVPELIVARIGAFVDEIRTGVRPEPHSQDVRLGLGVLWGEQVRAQVGWRWVHLSYPNGFASYALVPDDRAFACFPLNRVAELMTTRPELSANTSVPLFDSIRVGTLPARRENAYLVIG
jgi:hypothetical protein